jgi:hypothetical protein
MLHYIFLFFSLTLVLEARENPFFPANDASDIPLTTNQVERILPLKRASVTLPSTARNIESITITYKNLDGSLSKKKLVLHNSIDWHIPIFISQSYTPLEEKTYKKQHQISTMKRFIKLPFITFYQNKKHLKIVTRDKLLRSFLLVKPQRIVCDFKKNRNIRSYKKTAPQGSLFRKIRIGSHKGYYRVVIELDGYYRYKVKKLNNAYLFNLL